MRFSGVDTLLVCASVIGILLGFDYLDGVDLPEFSAFVIGFKFAVAFSMLLAAGALIVSAKQDLDRQRRDNP